IAARAEDDAQAGTVYRALLAARAGHGDDLLTALGWPTRHLEVDVVVSESWGVASGAVERLVPIRRTLAGRGHAPPITGPAVSETAGAVERLVEVLLEAAATELRLRRLAEALARTTRQVNTLDRQVRPGLEQEAARVRALLEEREREDHARLKRMTGARAPAAAATLRAEAARPATGASTRPR
ncbi:MAG: V-type ATP synthase subunit D, partial [Gemmatimonadales bacterium]